MGKNEQKEKLNMNLAEKIFQERKKLGLSQEQFAEKMEISRQAVSKWESGQSMPDLDKLVMMSQIFGVSTDYLLKDNSDEADFMQESFSEETIDKMDGSGTFAKAEEEMDTKMAYKEPERILNIEEIEAYQKVSFNGAQKIALGVVFCIMGAVANLATEMVFTELLGLKIGDFEALPLLLCVAVAIALFVPTGMQLEKFTYLKKERFTIPDFARERIQAEAELFQKKFSTAITAGIIIIILGVIACSLCDSVAAITGNLIWEEYVSGMILLIMVAAGVYLFVLYGNRKEYYNVILQQEEFATNRKTERNKTGKMMEVVSGIYWCIVTAGYLGYSFITWDWGRSWIVWPVAGCLFGAIAIFVNMLDVKKNSSSSEI